MDVEKLEIGFGTWNMEIGISIGIFLVMVGNRGKRIEKKKFFFFFFKHWNRFVFKINFVVEALVWSFGNPYSPY